MGPVQPLSDEEIVRAVAHKAAERITRRAIGELQRMTDTLSGEDSELRTTWDEICAQVQYEQSFYWEAYEESVRGLVDHYVSELPQHERDAIWLQTDRGIEWQCKDPADREPYPFIDGVVDYVMKEYVYERAGQWSNPRIRAYIDRAGMTD